MSFQILHPGPLALVQDYGRLGHQHLGMSPGGPVDEQAFLWANKLLGNAPNTATLEITLGPFRLKALEATHIALTGADMRATLNEQPLQAWSSHAIQAGDMLELKMAHAGLRCYLAVAGGFTVKPVYGSCATVQREQLGGLNGNGSALQADDVLHFPSSPELPKRFVPPQFRPDYTSELTLHLLPSYQHEQFEKEQLERLCRESFRVSPQANRMGYRLDGPAISPPDQGLISEGIAYGAVQVPADGQPIILMKDRQTIGGYAKLGCISSMDVFQLSQRRPGQKVRFQIARLETLSANYRAFIDFFGLDGLR